MSKEPQRTCPSCGNEFSGAMEFCPVCMLRKGLAGGVESGESPFEEAVRPTPDQPPKRFEHYELATGEDGKPVELGRGAMDIKPTNIMVSFEERGAVRTKIIDLGLAKQLSLARPMKKFRVLALQETGASSACTALISR